MRNTATIAVVALVAGSAGAITTQATEPHPADAATSDARIVRELKRVNRNLSNLNRVVGERPAADPTNTVLKVLKEVCENTAADSASALAC
jgi:hypothetical protein